jgi:hypothetical protein
MSADHFRKLGFDLAYLSMLTKAGLKPISRWEKEFAPEAERILGEMGLITRTVRRSVRSGKLVRELLFSESDRSLDLYVSRFDGKPIDPTPANMRIEGLLFGYPTCCVESYITKGYAGNSLRRSDQRLLFHWACRNCPITPLLLPCYRRIHRECRRALQGRLFSALTTVRDGALSDPLRQAVATAASLIALGTLAPSEAKYVPVDPHWTRLEASEDPDGDLLSTHEELVLNMDPEELDEDGNLVPDGVDLAATFSSTIDLLPSQPSSDETYIVHNMMHGLETCQTCGEEVNMGFMEIINPAKDLACQLPYIAKHYLEHGGLSFAGDLHAGRLDVDLLQTVLGFEGFGHFIPEPPGTDADEDGLRDREEPVFGTLPDDRDTDGDGVRDGIELAKELRAQLNSLPIEETEDSPYIIQHPMDGIETCPRCGADVVMDLWHVINPLTHNSMWIPSMALHYMEHGGFSWQGGYLRGGKGRIDPGHLRAVLSGEGDGHRWCVSPDSDGDLLTDWEELDLGSNLSTPDQDGNGILDGIDLAESVVKQIAALPTKPVADQVHRLDFQMNGLETCDICGEDVNMGFLTVVNPVAELFVKVPYIAIHAMEHGCFSYAGNVHGEGRLDVKLLVDALRSSGPGHMLDVEHDEDGDGLADHEEQHFGTNKAVADSDGDGVPDGFALAHHMWDAVGNLPKYARSEDAPNDAPFRVDHMARGFVACDTCGEAVNMGSLDVINPKEQISLALPYMCLHYMQHGSFAYRRGMYVERLSPCLLNLTLNGDGTSHLVISPPDKDADGLLDAEEPVFRTRADLPDSDGDGILDGVALARKMCHRIRSLPTAANAACTYAIHYEADCYAPCSVCGEEINCGCIEVTNPLSGLSTTLSYASLHFMERGSFAASPDVRVDPLLLHSILQPGVVIAAGQNQTTLRWKGAMGKTYQVYIASDLSGPWTPGPVFQGSDAELVYSDDEAGAAARRFYKILAW